MRLTWCWADRLLIEHNASVTPTFDRSFLPPAQLELVVIGDTHYIRDPEPYAIEFASVRAWPQRAQFALRAAAAVAADVVVHLGDLAEENPQKPGHREAREQACAQIAAAGLKPHHVAGNMDIGDKPDATMWSDWVTPQTLAAFHERFGRSWYSFDHPGLHGVVLNSQIIGSQLPEAAAQQAWIESDLEQYATRRLAADHLLVFMHMPPFFVEAQEPDVGFYNSINEPGRSWVLQLLARYRVDLLFCGHTHFRALNRWGDTRLYVAPSTTTSRAGFYEAFTVAPPEEAGRNDTAKLGFYLVRNTARGLRVHMIRTGGATATPAAERGWRRLLTCTSADLPQSPLGVLLRSPLATLSAGALAWPSALRQRVRDDHPLLACLELGCRYVRLPVSDLDDPLLRERLQLLRDEGVAVVAIWLWSSALALSAAVARHRDLIDAVELQVPGTAEVDKMAVQQLLEAGSANQVPVALAPMLVRERTPQAYHPRTRIGFRAPELAALGELSATLGGAVDRVVCHLDPDGDPAPAMVEVYAAGEAAGLPGLDFVISPRGGDGQTPSAQIAAALLAARQHADSRVFIDPLVDLDRTNDLCQGLLDRLSNPRPQFHAARCCNTVLYANQSRSRQWRLHQPDASGNDATTVADGTLVVDVTRGLIRELHGGDAPPVLRAGEPYLVSDAAEPPA